MLVGIQPRKENGNFNYDKYVFTEGDRHFQQKKLLKRVKIAKKKILKIRLRLSTSAKHSILGFCAFY